MNCAWRRPAWFLDASFFWRPPAAAVEACFHPGWRARSTTGGPALVVHRRGGNCLRRRGSGTSFPLRGLGACNIQRCRRWRRRRR